MSLMGDSVNTTLHPFVGREAELASLQALIQQGAGGMGCVGFIEGERGIGKTELLATLQERIADVPELAHARFVVGQCDEVNSQNAYQPLVEMLSAFIKEEKRGQEIGKLFLTIIKETGPDWLQIIPGVGPAVSAGLKTATLAGQLLADTADRSTESANLNSQYTKTILQLATKLHPLVLIIEDGHWIDQSSGQLLLQLTRSLQRVTLVILISYQPSYLGPDHPLKKLQFELQMRGQATIIQLSGLTEEQLQHYVRERFGSSLQPNLTRWLLHLCNGNPFFISHYLSLLEQEQIIRLREDSFILDGRLDIEGEIWNLSENIPIPTSVEMLLQQRIQRLMADDQRLLQQAAVVGENFMSSILANLLQVKEIDILPRLRVLVDDHRLIRYGRESEQWTDERAEVYAFEHMLMHRVFYDKLSPREKVLYHREVAAILVKALTQDPNPNRKLLLEAARHHDLGDQPRQAAQHYWRAAQSSFADGAFPETESLCRKLITTLDRLRLPPPDDERLRSEAIQLLLLASEVRWHSLVEGVNKPDLEQFAEQAEAAAVRSGDMALIAQAVFLHGHILIATRNFPDAIALMEKALEHAQQAEDALLEFVILSRLGHESASQNLTRGMEILYKAQDLYQTKLAKDPSLEVKPMMLARAYHRLQSLIGVGEFDQGNHDLAMDWLQKSIAGLKPLKVNDYLLAPYNFLAQVFIACGLFEEAESLLQEALLLFDEEEEPNPWNGYNLALLGKLYLEWGRIEEAGKVLTSGWEQTLATWYVAMALLVKNYYAELLMTPSFNAYDPEKADLLLSETVRVGRETGSHRSAITALMLRSRLALMQGKPSEALEFSSQSYEYLQEMGMSLPALRTEEVLFQHSLALAAANHTAESRKQLKAAYKVLEKKLGQFSSDRHRQAFETRVPLNRMILTAVKEIP